MSIQFPCESCQKKLQVPESAAGKKGRCNQCGHLNTIPSASDAASAIAEAAGSSPQPSAGPVGAASPVGPQNDGTFSVRSSVNGSVFGPADRQTLDQWLEEGRITPTCQLQQSGSESWTAAKDFFPSLGGALGAASGAAATDPFSSFQTPSSTPGGGADLNPYAATPRSASSQPVAVGGEIVPTSGDIGFCISHGFEMWKKHFGVLLGITATVVGINYAFQILQQVFFVGVANAGAGQGMMVGLGLVVFGLVVIGGVVQIWLTAGSTKVMCKLCRGQQANYGDMFGAGGRILPIIGMYLLIVVPLVVVLVGAMALLGALTQGNEAVLGLGVIVIALVAVVAAILCWPILFLVIDRDLFLEAFSPGIAIGSKNILQMIPIGIVCGVVGMSGVLACGIGILATIPLAQMMMATAYLNMSGQLKPR